MKLNITPTFAVMLKTLARQNNAEVEEYIEGISTPDPGSCTFPGVSKNVSMEEADVAEV